VSLDNAQHSRQQFPGNFIPQSRLDPAAQAALQHYPRPNANAGPFFRNNYFVVSQLINKATGFIATVDHTFLEKQRLTVRLSRSSGINGSAFVFPTIADSAEPSVDANSRGISVEHIYTASSTNINTLSVQADSNRFASQLLLDEAGTPFPRFDIPGYRSMGRNNPVARDVLNTFRLTDTFATRVGAHRFSAGFDLTHLQIHSFRPRSPEGRYEFSAGLTSVPGVINTGHAFASFLLGSASFAERRMATAPSYFRWTDHRSIFTDQWQVTPSLTLNLGANLEIRYPRVEKHDRQSNISFDEINPENGRPGALAVAGQDGYGRSFQPGWTKVEPYASLAWSVLGDNNTVLRINYQRRYDGYRTEFGQFGTQAFNGSPTWLSSNPQLAPALVLGNGLPTDRIFPDLRPTSANGTLADYVDTSKRQPTRQDFVVSIQRQLAPFLILTAEYHRQRGRDQLIGTWAVNPNAIPLSALAYRDRLNNLEFSSALRPFPQYQNFDVSNIYPDGRFRNNFVRLQIEKRTSAGLALNFSYRYIRQWDDFSGNVQNVFDRNREWALSSFTNPHESSFSYIYELPFGPNQPFLNFTDWRRYLAGGWAISGVTTIRSGRPLQLQAQFNNTGGVVQNLRAREVPGVDPHVADQGPELWFNPAAFVQPDDFTLGDTPRIHPTLRNPWFQNSDLNVNKRIAIDGERTLEFVASMFNFMNQGNWNDPDILIGPGSAPNANAGKIIGSTGGRIVQLGARLNF
jgi:hypothetical protein